MSRICFCVISKALVNIKLTIILLNSTKRAYYEHVFWTCSLLKADDLLLTAPNMSPILQ